MRAKFQLLSLMAAIVLTSCSKENPKTNATRTVKYEITTTSPVISPTTIAKVSYTNSSTGSVASEEFKSGNVWEKTVTLTAPVDVQFYSDKIFLESAGRITANIYVDGELKTTWSQPTRYVGGQYFETPGNIGWSVK